MKEIQSTEITDLMSFWIEFCGILHFSWNYTKFAAPHFLLFAHEFCMNSYSWSSRARQDEGLSLFCLCIVDTSFSDDEYSVQRICQRVYQELRREGKHKSLSIDELSHRLDYDIEGNKEVMDVLENYSLIEVDYPNFRYKVLSCALSLPSHLSMLITSENC